MNNNDLQKDLIVWFDLNKKNFNKIHFWSRNKIAILFKTELKKAKRWKNLPRGKPVGNKNNLTKQIKIIPPKIDLTDAEKIKQLETEIKKIEQDTMLGMFEKENKIKSIKEKIFKLSW